MREVGYKLLEHYFSHREKGSIEWELALAWYKIPFFFKNGKRRKKENFKYREEFNHYKWCRDNGLDDVEARKIVDNHITYMYEFIPKLNKELYEHSELIEQSL